MRSAPARRSPPQRQPLFVPVSLVFVLLLAAACSSVPNERAAPQLPPLPTEMAPEPAVTAPRKPDESPLQAFERRQRETARSAMKQGRWADAIWAWDSVLALEPQDAEALAQRAAALSEQTAALAERLPRAQQAQQRGDWETAARAYLDILLLAPTHGPAAEALREIERARTRRGTPAVAKFAPSTAAAAAPKGPTRAAVPLARTGSLVAAAGVDRNDLEHASLLAAQGELDAAIALLRPQALAPRAALQMRRLLASFYFRLASRLEMADRSGAIKALEQGLEFDPGHTVALARLKLLRPAAPR